METGQAAIGDDDKTSPDLGGYASTGTTPTFRITSLPTFGQLYIDKTPTNGNSGDWVVVTAQNVAQGDVAAQFDATAALHWVLTDQDTQPTGAAMKPSFTYVAVDGTAHSAPATVTIETPVIADPVLTGDDAIPTLAGFIDSATGQPYQLLTFKKLDIGGAKENNGTADPIGPLDGDINAREAGTSGGDPADLGGFAMQAEDGLGFYLTSLPATGKLYYGPAGGLGNGSGLTEIMAANLLAADGSNIATALKLNTGQELYWITTGADLTKQAAVTFGGQNQTLSQWENPANADGLTIDVTAFGFDGKEGYIVTQDGEQGVKGSDGTTSGVDSRFVKGGIGIQGEAPNVAFAAPDWEAELGRGVRESAGTTEMLRFDFNKNIAEATIQVSHMYLSEGEIGVADLYLDGRFVKSVTFGQYDAAISKVRPDLIVTRGLPTDANGNTIGVEPGKYEGATSSGALGSFAVFDPNTPGSADFAAKFGSNVAFYKEVDNKGFDYYLKELPDAAKGKLYLDKGGEGTGDVSTWIEIGANELKGGSNQQTVATGDKLYFVVTGNEIGYDHAATSGFGFSPGNWDGVSGGVDLKLTAFDLNGNVASVYGTVAQGSGGTEQALGVWTGTVTTDPGVTDPQTRFEINYRQDAVGNGNAESEILRVEFLDAQGKQKLLVGPINIDVAGITGGETVQFSC